ncbi:hypothetical protein [Marisediminicola sp. LYQ134]|uniref:FMN-binding protein n=1 Tax=Marisediminicola sp. LYQ134 TaxID=3391061 RepID=UPI003983483F
MTAARRRTAALVFGGISVATALAGCSTPDASTGSDSTGGSAPTTSGDYVDGSYSAAGDYQSPGGTESIDVELTLADNIVTEVSVTGNATSGNAERYQSEFIDGIDAEVVGVDIDDLAVDKVAGSSLTSDGFMAAVAQIKADAAS